VTEDAKALAKRLESVMEGLFVLRGIFNRTMARDPKLTDENIAESAEIWRGNLKIVKDALESESQPQSRLLIEEGLDALTAKLEVRRARFDEMRVKKHGFMDWNTGRLTWPIGSWNG
jgi:DNA-directed RNA polymerase beta' subunit